MLETVINSHVKIVNDRLRQLFDLTKVHHARAGLGFYANDDR